MPALIQRVPWTVQPQEAVGVNWGSQLTQGLVFLENAAVSNALVTGLPTSVATSKGVAFSNLSATNYRSRQVSIPITSAKEVTVIVVASATASTASNMVFAVGSSTNASSFFGIGTTASNGAGLWIRDSASTDQSIGLGLYDGVMRVYGGVHSNAQGRMEAWTSTGGLGASTSPTTKTTFSGLDRVGFGCLLRSSAANGALNPTIAMAAVWGRALSAQEMMNVLANPWQLFQPRNASVWSPSLIQRAPWTVARSRLLGTSTGTVPTTAVVGVTKKSRVVQPQGGAPLNNGNSFVNRVSALFNFVEGVAPQSKGNRTPSGLSWSGSSTAAVRPANTGIGLYDGSTSAGRSYGTARSFDGFAPASSPMWFAFSTTYGAYVNQGSSVNVLWTYGGSGGTGFFVWSSSSNALSVQFVNATLASPALVAGQKYNIAGGRDASGNCWLWINGALVASGTGATGADSASSNALLFLDDGSSSRTYKGSIALFGMGSDNPQAWGAQLSANPWQLFAPSPSYVWGAP